MRSENLSTVNKYGKPICLPPQKQTKGERAITAVLDSCGISYQTNYRIDAPGCRRSPFDIAVMKDGQPRLFIEYDGEAHYKTAFFLDTGVRPERCMAHVVKSAIADAKKAAIAMRFGIPLLRIHTLDDDALRDRILAWVHAFVEDCDLSQGNEIILIDMLERYGFDFPYVHPSDMTKAEKARVEQLQGDAPCVK